jgi:cell division protein FtsI/penicillin-binding protein 2
VANIAATLARGGIFIRPTLLQDQTALAVKEARNLGLDPRGLEMARRGMTAAVQSTGGTGHSIDSTLPVPIAGKTGSAQAHPLSIAIRDEHGVQKRDSKGRALTEPLLAASRAAPNPLAPWYRRTSPMEKDDPQLAHGWYTGYLPADNPQIAFAVFVEYGGSGGTSAGSVVTQMADALVKHGYIMPTRQRDPAAAPGELKYIVKPVP